jgi:signal transduction histidine kinase
VRRHSGTRACRIELDLSSCPFTFRARDWGAGLAAGGQSGHGLELLSELADWLGCQLVVASQPGLGTDLVVYGHRWVGTEKPILQAPSEGVIKFVSR